MSDRQFAAQQPDSFTFSAENLALAKTRIAMYPEGRQASAIIPLLWLAQEQAGWLSVPAIEYVADMLGMPHIRALEVASFYFMFQLAPVGRHGHVQVCGTTPCMLCGCEDLIAICREEIAAEPHEVSADGLLSWEEVECLGACANAPVVQIGKDYYEDLSPDIFRELLAAVRRGERPRPGSRTGRFASEALGAATILQDCSRDNPANAAVMLAVAEGSDGKL